MAPSQVGPAELKTHSITQRKPVISDSHEGITAAVSKVLTAT